MWSCRSCVADRWRKPCSPADRTTGSSTYPATPRTPLVTMAIWIPAWTFSPSHSPAKLWLVRCAKSCRGECLTKVSRLVAPLDRLQSKKRQPAYDPKRNGQHDTYLERARVSLHHRILGARAGRYPAGGNGRVFLTATRRGGNRRDPARHVRPPPPRHQRLCRARLRARLRSVLRTVSAGRSPAEGFAVLLRQRPRGAPAGGLVSLPHAQRDLSVRRRSGHPQPLLRGILAGCAGHEAAHLPARAHRVFLPPGGWHGACYRLLPGRDPGSAPLPAGAFGSAHRAAFERPSSPRA